jgi:hypothetical protein
MGCGTVGDASTNRTGPRQRTQWVEYGCEQTSMVKARLATAYEDGPSTEYDLHPPIYILVRGHSPIQTLGLPFL